MVNTSLAGQTYGKFEVLERLRSQNKKSIWKVKCLTCSNSYELATDTIKKNQNGCSSCSRTTQAKGVNSQYWTGGKYISSSFLSNFRRGAKRRGISFNLSIEELDSVWEKQDGKCVYTGERLIMGETASLDRIDSNKGYSADNVQLVDKDINILKWNWTEKYFLEMVAKVYEYSTPDGFEL